MNREDLFESMDGIDEKILERSEKASADNKKAWKVILPLAACFLLVLTGILYAQHDPEIPEDVLQNTTEATEAIGERLWNPSYKNAKDGGLAGDFAMPPGYFNEVLDEKMLQTVLPRKQSKWTDCTGRAGFLNDGTVDCIVLNLTTPNNKVTVTLGNYRTCCIYVGESIGSLCGDVEFQLFQCALKKGTLFEAETEINGVPFHFQMMTYDPERDRAEFEAVLECFSWYAAGKPNIGQIVPSRIVEYLNQKINWQQAQTDPVFGKLMNTAVPEGFELVDITRLRDYYSDYIWGYWEREEDYFYWKVAAFTEEGELRVTSVQDRENYDMALYPYPLVDTCPKELQGIVRDPIFEADELTLEVVRARVQHIQKDDGKAWENIQFSVKFGDLRVDVFARNVDPEWIYQQFAQIRENLE